MHICIYIYYHHHLQNSHFLAIAYRRMFRQIVSGFHFLGFHNSAFFLQRKVVGLASNTKPGRSGLCIYVRQWKGSPIVTPGTRFPFRRLLWLAGLMWKHSNPLSRNVSASYEFQNNNIFHTPLSAASRSKSRGPVTSDANTNLSIAIGVFEQGSLTLGSNTTNGVAQLSENCVVTAQPNSDTLLQLSLASVVS
jgi:hypothetical protein